jgi:hypothetical protein
VRSGAGPAAQSAAVIAVGLSLGACGGSVALTAHPAPRSAVARAQATHEYPSPAPTQHASGAAPSASAAVARFATAYINWTAATVAAHMRWLATHSIGQARAAMQLAAAQTASDYELQHGGIANQGTVEAISPLAGGGDRFVVVTRELTTASATTAYQGLEPAWHVALVTVSRVATGEWVVSGWQPES